MGSWPALIPSIDPTCHFTVSPRLGFMTATALGCSTQPATSLSLSCSNNSLPHSDSSLLSSHTEPRTFRAQAATDLAKCRASRIRHPSELHAASRTSVPSRSFQGGSRVGYVLRSSVAPPDRFAITFLHDSHTSRSYEKLLNLSLCDDLISPDLGSPHRYLR